MACDDMVKRFIEMYCRLSIQPCILHVSTELNRTDRAGPPNKTLDADADDGLVGNCFQLAFINSYRLTDCPGQQFLGTDFFEEEETALCSFRIPFYSLSMRELE